MLSVYGLLDRDARNWWYHAKLRAEGQADEARRRERQSIRENARTLREARDNGGFVHVGRGGWGIHYRDGCTLSGYGGMDALIVQAALQVGILVVDTTTIPDDTIWESVRLPIPSLNQDDGPPYGCLSYAPVSVWVEMYRELGATVYNG